MRRLLRWVGLGLAALIVASAAPALGQSATAAGTVAVYFSPEDRPGAAVVQAFASARHEILAVIYEFTEAQIANALVAASRRHVDVWMVMDESASRDRGSQSYRLAQILGTRARLRAGVDGASGIVHDKFAVVGGTRVLTRSFNWTYSAEDRNWENLVIIESPPLAQAYAREFRHIWDAP